MHRVTRVVAALLATTAAAHTTVRAQQSTTNLSPRELTRAEAESPEHLLSAINAVRATSRGRIFVNDRAARHVVMLDRDLSPVRVVIDASPATGALYGLYATRMFAMPGDSTVFLDNSSGTFTVLDPEGRIARRVPVPVIPVREDLVHVLSGTPAFDARGRLVYRSLGRPQRELIEMGPLGTRAKPERVPLLRLDLATGNLDTATFVQIYQQRQVMLHQASRSSVMPLLHPAPMVDEWAMLFDGTIAILRGADYHVDFIRPDGALVSGAPIPYPTRDLRPADKAALLDSSRAVRARMLAAGLPLGQDVAPLPGAVFHSAPPVIVSGDGSPVPFIGASPPPDQWVSPGEIPDRLPVFSAGSVRADADGNLWVQTIRFTQERRSFVYDVIDRSGTLVDRVQVPSGASIVGFAPGGVVLLAQREGNSLRLARAHHEVRAGPRF